MHPTPARRPRWSVNIWKEGVRDGSYSTHQEGVASAADRPDAPAADPRGRGRDQQGSGSDPDVPPMIKLGRYQWPLIYLLGAVIAVVSVVVQLFWGWR